MTDVPHFPGWLLVRVRARACGARTLLVNLPQSEGIMSIEADEGKAHLTCKDVSV